MSGDDNKSYISEQWHALTAAFTHDKELAESCLEEIIAAYSQRRRYYHNLSHIAQMLRLSDEYAHALLNKPVVDFAIFYHDCVYKVPGSHNEEKSAAFAAERLKVLSVPDQMVREVVSFIEATKAHELREVANPGDLQYFLDFDMAILAAGWNEYIEYARSIRREYTFYPDILYYNGRADFLKKTLQKERIYHTEAFRSVMEKNARANLARELEHTIKG